MLEDSIPAAWASLNSWFTPTLLFVFLNLMIGTIAIASGVGTQKQQPQNQQQQQQQQQDYNNQYGQQQQLGRSPSLLQRIRSINLYRYRSQDLTPFSSITTKAYQPPESEQTQHVLNSFREQPMETQTSYENLEDFHQMLDEIHNEAGTETETETEAESGSSTPFHNVEEHHVTRTVSDTKPASGDMPVKLSRKMRKSASTKSAFSHFEEREIVQPVVRPATVREGKKELQSFGDDEEVDAKADDFINKFKQQLKLQRLDSIIRYKEMLGRGATTQ